MILIKKTLQEIMEESLRELEGMGISEKDAGGTARLFLAIINRRIAGFYETLDVNMIQAFVSQARGTFLDRIGLLLDCHRRPEEENNDEAYRYRITKQIQVIASANYAAVRLAALSVPGVQDVKMKRWTHGTGSFSVYVISEDPITPQAILDEVQLHVDEACAYGNRAEVFRPSIIPVEIKIRLIFNKTVVELDRKLAITQVEDAVKKYFNSRNVEDPIQIEEIRKLIRSIHEGIEEIIIFHFAVNNRPALLVDQKCAWNERFIQSDKPNAVQVM